MIFIQEIKYQETKMAKTENQKKLLKILNEIFQLDAFVKKISLDEFDEVYVNGDNHLEKTSVVVKNKKSNKVELEI